MSRNGSGTMSVPNTFTPGTTITASGHNQNWSDAATEFTNSIAADGQTPITGALKGASGTASAPGYAFNSDPNTGIYRIGADNLGIAAGGTKILDVAATGLDVIGTLGATGAIGAADGTVSLPEYSFTADPDSGVYRIGDNEIGVGVAGAKVLDISGSGLDVIGALTVNGSAVSNLVSPQGRLTLVSGSPIMTSDQAAQSTVYYTPYIGNLIPVWNGSVFELKTFAELSMVMSGSNFAANAIYDLFVASDSGTLRLAIGPVWSTLTAGSGARGTGAGSTELEFKNGILVNKNSITLRYASGSTFSASADQATYVGSIYMDGTNAQVSCHASFGQSRKFGLWNAYNRILIALKAGDGTASWTPGTGPRPWNNTASNSLTIFQGLVTGPVVCRVDQAAQMELQSGVTAGVVKTGIGFNSTSAFNGTVGENNKSWSNAGSLAEIEKLYLGAQYVTYPGIGIHTVTALEAAANSASQLLYGTEAGGTLTALWMG